MNDDGTGCLVIIVLLATGVWFAIWGRDSALRYSVQYEADRSMVTVERKPTDCDFLRAPMGRKDCNYEKEILVAKHRRDTASGRAIVSFDDGKSWEWNDGGPEQGTSVYVTWRRKTP